MMKCTADIQRGRAAACIHRKTVDLIIQTGSRRTRAAGGVPACKVALRIELKRTAQIEPAAARAAVVHRPRSHGGVELLAGIDAALHVFPIAVAPAGQIVCPGRAGEGEIAAGDQTVAGAVIEPDQRADLPKRARADRTPGRAAPAGDIRRRYAPTG